ncbi:MAG: CCA tRNA nucleotidyltransferase [Bacillota bacterium]
MDLVQVKNLLADVEGQFYFVGGVLRDYFLNRDIADVDLVVEGPTRAIARKFAGEINGSFVVLDSARAIYRIVTSDLVYDFSALAGASIEEDLSRRDFTINALALNINQAEHPRKGLIDPYGGLNDINQGILRAVTDESFADDPLRVLRAVRFKAQLDFAITASTEQLMLPEVKKLEQIANERSREELVKIFSYPGVAENIDYLDKLGVLSEFQLNEVTSYSKTVVEEIEELLTTDYWQSKIDKSRRPLLKLAVLGQECAKQSASLGQIRSILRELTFSNQQIKYILLLLRYYKRPLELSATDKSSFGSKYRFFKAVSDSVADVCLLAAASSTALSKTDLSARLDFLRELIATKEDFDERTKQQLISGADLMQELGVEEGPRVGKILAKVEQQQGQGLINTRREALDYARQKNREL